jgi:hypothetical protein
LSGQGDRQNDQHLSDATLRGKPNVQSAFRKNLCTEDHIAYLAQDIENAFQDKKKTLTVLKDLTKAFDNVWKNVFFKPLNTRV